MPSFRLNMAGEKFQCSVYSYLYIVFMFVHKPGRMYVLFDNIEDGEQTV